MPEANRQAPARTENGDGSVVSGHRIGELLAMLDAHRVGVLATLRADGEPHAAVMHFSVVRERQELLFSTDRNSVKVSGIAQHPRAAFASGWSEEEWKTFQVRGRIRVAADAELPAAHACHYAKHPQSAAFKDDPNTVFLILTADWIRYSDLGTLPEQIEEVEL